jgi:glycosyl transferase family 87
MKDFAKPNWQLAGKLAITVIFSAAMLAYYSFSFFADQGLDFRMFYAAAASLRTGGPTVLSDHPPITPLLYFPFSYFGIQRAYVLWSALSFCVLFCCAALLSRATHAFRDSYWSYLMCFVFLPVHITFLQGQVDLIVLLAYVLAFTAMRANLDGVAGLVLALGLLKFHLVLPFAAVMLLRKQWRFLIGFAVGTVLVLAVCVSVAGPDFLTTYPKHLLHSSTILSSGYSPGMMANLHGLLYFIFRGDHPILVLALSMVLLLWVAGRWRSLEQGFAGTVVATVLAGYHLNPHDLVLLLFPLAFALPDIRWASVRGTILLALALPILPRLALSAHVFPLVAILEIAFGLVFFWIPASNSANSSLGQSPSNRVC